ncbi:agmatine deiminase family protein, partial [Flagellimonas flava]|uniref:agmatine deiminase family protein n=1 Tax=Flagellimonas flava TaxID=570519 RepID=UPI003D649646
GPLSTADRTKAYTVVGTSGHVDEYARFDDDCTILLASIDSAELRDPIAKENHRRLEENFKVLSKSTNQDGNAFRIVRM